MWASRRRRVGYSGKKVGWVSTRCEVLEGVCVCVDSNGHSVLNSGTLFQFINGLC